jgi:hypothetical protein
MECGLEAARRERVDDEAMSRPTPVKPQDEEGDVRMKRREWR